MSMAVGGKDGGPSGVQVERWWRWVWMLYVDFRVLVADWMRVVRWEVVGVVGAWRLRRDCDAVRAWVRARVCRTK